MLILSLKQCRSMHLQSVPLTISILCHSVAELLAESLQMACKHVLLLSIARVWCMQSLLRQTQLTSESGADDKVE